MLEDTPGKRVEDMPVNPKTLQDLYTAQNFDVYKDFCQYFVSGVVGIRHFDRNKCILPLHKYVSSSDEAFTILTLENNWSRWSSMAEAKNWKDSEVPSAWTTSMVKRKPEMNQDKDIEVAETPQARRYRGWTAKGILRYNELHAEIKEERKKDIFDDFETYCIEYFQEKAEEQGNNNHKRRKKEQDRPLPIATHDLWDDDITEDQQDLVVSRLLPAGMSGKLGI